MQGTEIKRALLIFVDGMGIGPADPLVNPFASVECEVLKITEADGPGLKYGGVLRAIDALLDMPGVPQSATGQTSILTGINASKRRGGHLKGFPDDACKAMLDESGILKQAREAGLNTVFANAYRSAFFEWGHMVPPSVTTAATQGAGLRLKSPEDVRNREAVYQEFTNEPLAYMEGNVPIWTPDEAGEVLARITGEHDFTLYEYFQTDKSGHSRDLERAGKTAKMLDQFMDAALAAIDLSSTLVMLTSDHGNMEDITVKDHTSNPVPIMVWGPGAEQIAGKARSITDIAPILRNILGI